MRITNKLSWIVFLLTVLSFPVKGLTIEEAQPQLYDSLSRDWKEYDQSRLQNFKEDPDFNYENAKVDLNIIQRLWYWFRSLFDGLFADSEVGFWPKIFEYLLYIMGIAGVVFLIIKLFQSGLSNAIYGNPKSSLEYHLHEDDIHEIDFMTAIEEAVDLGEYRKAIRLVYLHALKMLSDQHLISWERGKTNHDYLYELKSKGIQQPFSDLGYYFEFTWYGNFEADRKIYDHTFSILKDLEAKLKQDEKN